MIGDRRCKRARLWIGDADPRAAIPVKRLLRIQAQLFANALNQQVLLGADA